MAVRHPGPFNPCQPLQTTLRNKGDTLQGSCPISFLGLTRECGLLPGWRAELNQRKLAHKVLGGTLRTLGPACTGPGGALAFPASIKLGGGDQSAQTARPHATATRGKQSPAPLCGGSRVGGGEPPSGEGLRGACALTPARPPPCPARTGRPTAPSTQGACAPRARPRPPGAPEPQRREPQSPGASRQLPAGYPPPQEKPRGGGK